MIFELCNKYVLMPYLYGIIIHYMMLDDDIVVKLRYICRPRSSLAGIETLNCGAKDWHW